MCVADWQIRVPKQAVHSGSWIGREESIVRAKATHLDYDGESAAALRKDYDIFEGNLMRGILKLAALVNEWTAVATYRADVAMLDKCRSISEGLLRDVAIPESLYLRM